MSGRDSVIPDYTFPPRTDASGQAPTGRANAGASGSMPKDLSVYTLGRDQIIPILYGGPERMAGLVYLVATPKVGPLAGSLIIASVLCEGPVEDVSGFEADNEPLPANITIHAYDGTQTTVDTWLAQAVDGFDETLEGFAYFVARVTPVNGQFPNITALVKGLLVEDPRVVAPAAWSDNPALCLANFMERYAGLPVNNAYTASAADWCDRLITGAGGTEKFSTITLALAQKRQCHEWIEIMRAYVPAWVVNAGDSWRIVADMPRATDHFFGAGTISADSPPSITRGGTRDVPNFVEVAYTDTRTLPWQTMTQYAEVLDAVEVRRSRVEMPGIRGPAQAKRFAVERLNHYTLEDVTGQISVFDEGLKVLRGDVIAISEAAFGWAGKLFRVLDAGEHDTGRWSIQFREYDPAAYSTEVAVAPSTPDTSLSSPLSVEPPTNIILEEVLAPESEMPNDGIGRGIIYQSRIRVRWTESSDPYLSDYEIIIRLGAEIVFTSRVARSTGVHVSSTVKQLTEYSVSVVAINGMGVRSAELTDEIFIDGKQFPPSDVPAIVQATELGGDVILAWDPAADFDTLRYEWRVDFGNAALAWDLMTTVDAIDGLRARFRGLPEGTHRFCVKALDSVGNYSPNPLCVVITVTSDQGSFLQDSQFVNPTLVKMIKLNTPFVEGESPTLQPRWVTNEPTTSWDASMPSPIDSGTEEVFSYGRGAVGKCSWRGESVDVGFEAAGQWYLKATIYEYVGTAKRFLEHSLDGVAWTQEPMVPNVPWVGSARFVRPYFEATAIGDSFLIEGPPVIQLSAEERTESGGPETSSASLPKTVTLFRRYSKATQIVITPAGTSMRSPTVNNVVVGPSVANSFDVHLFDSNGNQVADSFYWTFKGV